MDDPIELAIELRDEILELPEAKEFLRLKDIIDKDEEIRDLQKQISELENLGKNDEANVIRCRLNNLPIMMNFQIIKEQLADTLRVISDILK